MSKPTPFPAITGSCVCNLVRYRLLTSPLYVYACHCADCQKSTGSAFALLLNIELPNIQVITPTVPVAVKLEKKQSGLSEQHVECPRCKTHLWSDSWTGPQIRDLRVGTLDFPGLMEPDIHIFVDSKLDWVRLPDDAKTTPRDYNLREHWPKSSLRRLDSCFAKLEEAKREREAAAKIIAQSRLVAASRDREGLDDVGEGEKTPTAIEPGDADIEDDEAFEKRFRETERALQERLEKLSLKLQGEESAAGQEQQQRP
ncbi:hypothetical protein ACN47E_004335 [Coniothyrium glycines]